MECIRVIGREADGYKQGTLHVYKTWEEKKAVAFAKRWLLSGVEGDTVKVLAYKDGKVVKCLKAFIKR